MYVDGNFTSCCKIVSIWGKWALSKEYNYIYCELFLKDTRSKVVIVVNIDCGILGT
jgi:hypothetical protein